MQQDYNKKISKIQYNLLNLPAALQFTNGNRKDYTYSADGKKLKVVHRTAIANISVPMGQIKELAANQVSQTHTVDYCGNVIYENGSLSKVLTEEGYVTLSGTTPTFYYHLKDHQGNNRMVVRLNGTSWNTEQVNHYYPFGGVFEVNTETSGKQSYKYNEKELDRMHGLDWYDYGARMMDAALGRWHVMDPLAEKYYSISPYVYCGNNPVRYTDPGGDSIRVYTETQATGHTWISVGEGEDLVVYSYGRYNGTNKGPDGSSNSLADGPGVLLKLTGEEAKAYNEKKATNGMSVFVITDVADEVIATAMDEKFNSSTVMPNTGEYQDSPSAHVIDKYSLTSNNCTTIVSDVLNNSGSKALNGTMYQQTSSLGTWTTVPVQHRFVVPASMQNYLIKTSKPRGTVYRTR